MIPPRILAYSLMAGGAICLVWAAFVTWGGITRWFAVSNLREAQVLAQSGDLDGAHQAGRSAAEWLPGSAVTVLAATDPADPAAVDRLTAAARGQNATDRTALAAGAGAILGRVPDGLDVGPGDLPFLQALASKQPGPVTRDPDQPPHEAVLAAWAAGRLTAAWLAHRRTDVYEAAGTVLLLAPRHPQAADLTLIVTALAPQAPRKAELIKVAAEIPDAERRRWLGRHLLALAPERNELRMLGGAVGAVASDDAALDAVVASAKAAPEAITDGAIIACLQAGKPDLADELIALAPVGRKAALSKLQSLVTGGDFTADPAQISPPIAAGEDLTFHLSNRAGALPTGRITVTIGQTEIPSDQVRRQGTLICVPLRVRGRQDLRITYDGAVVFAANLGL